MGTSWDYGERDYRAIEDALMRSDYGRWFLGEYLARNRSDETQRLLDALDRLEASLAASMEPNHLPRLREISLEIDAALDDALSHIVPAEAKPASAKAPPIDAILEAVEDINGFLEAMSARRVQQRFPEKIRARLAAIQRCCAHVDTASESKPALVEVLTTLRQRLASAGLALAAETPAEAAATSARLPSKLINELAAAFADKPVFSANY